MDKKVEELVEWVAKELYFEGEHFDNGTVAAVTWTEGNPKRLAPFYQRAKRILSHPDLALMLRPQHIDWEKEIEKVKQSRIALVIPLKEELEKSKEMKYD